jgi:hypothetical protein
MQVASYLDSRRLEVVASDALFAARTEILVRAAKSAILGLPRRDRA